MPVLRVILVFFILSFVSSLEINPLRGSEEFVAEIFGVNLESISDVEFNQLHEALLRYKIVVVRNQKDFSVEGQRSFTKRLGRLHVHLESSSHYPGYADVNVVSNIKNSTGHYIGLYGKHVENFHSDLSWTDIPTKITVLKSEIRPEECGDTEYIDSHAAYNDLPEEWKLRLRGLTAQYCYMKMRQFDEHGLDKNLRNDEIEKATKCAVHPLVTAHPITGRKNIYANPSHTARVNGVSEEESELILSFLFQHSAQAKFVYRHHYQDYDVVIWDNRAVHHRATGCPDEFPRKLIRTTVSNDDEPKEDIPVDSRWDLEKDRVNAEVYTHPTINSSPEL